MVMIVPPMAPQAIEKLGEGLHGVRFVVARDASEAVSQAGAADALFGLNSPALYDSAPLLRWVQSGSAGVEGYPLELFRSRGIRLTNAKEIYGIQLADHAIALILAFSRQLPFLYRAQQEERWEDRSHYPPGELEGQVLLVIGLGGTGLQVARRARAFGMRVIATRRRDSADRADLVDELHPANKLLDLLPRADWVCVCVPLTSQTRGLIGERELRLMKNTAYLINVTRGGIVQTEALVEALKRGTIAGAGLDVTDPEPLPKGHPLWRMANVIVTPHAAGHSPAASARMLSLLRSNIERYLEGRELLNLVDLESGY